MRRLESRMEPYTKKNRKLYRGTEAFEASSNKIARYHIQIYVYGRNLSRWIFFADPCHVFFKL